MHAESSILRAIREETQFHCEVLRRTESAEERNRHRHLVSLNGILFDQQYPSRRVVLIKNLNYNAVLMATQEQPLSVHSVETPSSGPSPGFGNHQYIAARDVFVHIYPVSELFGPDGVRIVSHRTAADEQTSVSFVGPFGNIGRGLVMDGEVEIDSTSKCGVRKFRIRVKYDDGNTNIVSGENKVDRSRTNNGIPALVEAITEGVDAGSGVRRFRWEHSYRDYNWDKAPAEATSLSSLGFPEPGFSREVPVWSINQTIAILGLGLLLVSCILWWRMRNRARQAK
jgi:hypothetical protein